MDVFLSVTETNINYLNQRRKDILRQRRMLDQSLQRHISNTSDITLMDTESLFMNHEDNISRVLQEQESRKNRNSRILQKINSPLNLTTSHELQHRKLEFLESFRDKLPFVRSFKEKREVSELEQQVKELTKRLSLGRRGWKSELETHSKKREMRVQLSKLQQQLKEQQLQMNLERVRMAKLAKQEKRKLKDELSRTKEDYHSRMFSESMINTSEIDDEYEESEESEEYERSSSLRGRSGHSGIQLTKRPPPSQRTRPSNRRKVKAVESEESPEKKTLASRKKRELTRTIEVSHDNVRTKTDLRTSSPAAQRYNKSRVDYIHGLEEEEEDEDVIDHSLHSHHNIESNSDDEELIVSDHEEIGDYLDYEDVENEDDFLHPPEEEEEGEEPPTPQDHMTPPEEAESEDYGDEVEMVDDGLPSPEPVPQHKLPLHDQPPPPRPEQPQEFEEKRDVEQSTSMIDSSDLEAYYDDKSQFEDEEEVEELRRKQIEEEMKPVFGSPIKPTHDIHRTPQAERRRDDFVSSGSATSERGHDENIILPSPIRPEEGEEVGEDDIPKPVFPEPEEAEPEEIVKPVFPEPQRKTLMRTKNLKSTKKKKRKKKKLKTLHRKKKLSLKDAMKMRKMEEVEDQRQHQETEEEEEEVDVIINYDSQKEKKKLVKKKKKSPKKRIEKKPPLLKKKEEEEPQQQQQQPKRKQQHDIDPKEHFKLVLKEQTLGLFYSVIRILIKHVESMFIPSRKFLNISWGIQKNKLLKDLFSDPDPDNYNQNHGVDQTEEKKGKKKKRNRRRNSQVLKEDEKYAFFTKILQTLSKKPELETLLSMEEEKGKEEELNVKSISHLMLEMYLFTPYQLLTDGFANKLLQVRAQSNLVQIRKLIFNNVNLKSWLILLRHLKFLRKEVRVKKSRMERILEQISIHLASRKRFPSNHELIRKYLVLFFKYQLKIKETEEDENELISDDDNEEEEGEEGEVSNKLKKNKRRESFNSDSGSLVSDTFTFDSVLSTSEIIGFGGIDVGKSRAADSGDRGRRRRIAAGEQKKSNINLKRDSLKSIEDKAQDEFLATILEGVNPLDDSLVGTGTSDDDSDNPFSM